MPGAACNSRISVEPRPVASTRRRGDALSSGLAVDQAELGAPVQITYWSGSYNAQVGANSFRQPLVPRGIEGQHAPNRLCQQSELLFAIRKTGRLRHDVPVHVSIALLAAQAQHVQPFGRHAAPKRFADPMHPALQGHVLVLTEIARHVLDVAADVSLPEDAARVVRAGVEKFGRVDILVTNAGGPPAGRFETLSREDWERATRLTLTREGSHPPRRSVSTASGCLRFGFTGTLQPE